MIAGLGTGFLSNILILFFIYSLVLLPSAALISYCDRKLSARLQARVGPHRTGFLGMLQPFADLLKLLQKRSAWDWSWEDSVWGSFQAMVVYASLAALPLGSALLMDTEMSSFLPFFSALVLALGSLLLGLNQATIAGWLGGIRVVGQVFSGVFPAFIAFLCVGIHTGGFRWKLLASAQGFYPWSWTCLTSPFQLIAFLVFIISGLIILGLPPLEGSQFPSEIDGGVVSHLSGRRWLLFQLSKFYGFLSWSMVTVVLFLGAWSLPDALVQVLEAMEAKILVSLMEFFWLMSKTFVVMLAVIWIASANPRSRVDQMTDFAWRVLSPFALVALMGAALWESWVVF